MKYFWECRSPSKSLLHRPIILSDFLKYSVGLTVFGIISFQEVKAVEKLKDGIDFVTHKEKNVLEKIETRAKSKPVHVPVPAAESKENEIVDKSPTLCDTVVSVPLRQPLKDLKVGTTVLFEKSLLIFTLTS